MSKSLSDLKLSNQHGSKMGPNIDYMRTIRSFSFIIILAIIKKCEQEGLKASPSLINKLFSDELKAPISPSALVKALDELKANELILDKNKKSGLILNPDKTKEITCIAEKFNKIASDMATYSELFIGEK